MKAYEVITDRIIEALEQGVVPWRRPWRADFLPCIVCKEPVEPVLAELGSTTCHTHRPAKAA